MRERYQIMGGWGQISARRVRINPPSGSLVIPFGKLPEQVCSPVESGSQSAGDSLAQSFAVGAAQHKGANNGAFMLAYLSAQAAAEDAPARAVGRGRREHNASPTKQRR